METDKKFLELMGKMYIELSIAHQKHNVSDSDTIRVHNTYRLLQDAIEDNGYEITGDVNNPIEVSEW